MTDQNLRGRVHHHLCRLYPELTPAEAQTLVARVIATMPSARRSSGAASSGAASSGAASSQVGFTEDEVMLITYADTFRASDGQPHLSAFGAFFDEYLADVFSSVHLLPFSPSSSDGGFAVVDYREVQAGTGSWADIEQLALRVRLMVDLVCNHGSVQSAWFADFVADRAPGNGYYLTADPDDDLETVTRPRTHPLLRPTETAVGPKHVWATFSHDQVDFDYSNPDVLVEFCAILGFYLSRGATRIRLDAIAYLWKQVGTSCIHLPQTHEVVKLMRTLFGAADPGALIITETNVPHAENVSYFGEGDEAHVVYNFTLAPLIVSSLITGDSGALTTWLQQLDPMPSGCTFLNFLASHDGIGLRPLEGIADPSDIDALVEATAQTGGGVSTYMTPSGPRPYELNVSLADLLAGPTGACSDRFVLGHALLLSLQGIPAIYVHSMLASPGDTATVAITGHRRDINRAHLTLTEAHTRVGSGWRAATFDALRHLIRVRRAHPGFAPEASQRVLDLGPDVVAVLRGDAPSTVFAVHNLTGNEIEVEVDRAGTDAITGQTFSGVITLAPWQAIWLTDLRDPELGDPE